MKHLLKTAFIAVALSTAPALADAVKINAEQIFKQLSPGSEVKSI